MIDNVPGFYQVSQTNSIQGLITRLCAITALVPNESTPWCVWYGGEGGHIGPTNENPVCEG